MLLLHRLSSCAGRNGCNTDQNQQFRRAFFVCFIFYNNVTPPGNCSCILFSLLSFFSFSPITHYSYYLSLLFTIHYYLFLQATTQTTRTSTFSSQTLPGLPDAGRSHLVSSLIVSQSPSLSSPLFIPYPMLPALYTISNNFPKGQV